MTAPLICEWTGESFTPLARFMKQANKDFVVHDKYRLAVEEERSMAQHRRFFACLRDAWMNLPEGSVDDKWSRSEEALRKFALIKSGHCHSQSMGFSTDEDALRAAALAEADDDFSLVIVEGNLVTKYKAKSQSIKSMGRELFKKSSDDVLDYLAQLIGVSKAELEKRAEET